MSHALCRDTDDLVVNVIEVGEDYTPPDHCYLIDLQVHGPASPGDTWDSDSEAFVRADPAPPTEIEEARARLRELKGKGWSNLSASEKAEVAEKALTVLGAP